MPKLWISNPNNADTMYLFYPGIQNGQAVATHYIGNQRMRSSTNEEVWSSKEGIHTLPREKIWVYPELDEINRNPTIGLRGRLITWAEGIHVHPPTEEEYAVPYPKNETGTLAWYSIHQHKASLGQKTDIDNHKKKFDALMDPATRQNGIPEPQNIVLYGVSRGAATTFSALATHKEVYKNIKLCVLEAPPATISAVFKFYGGKFGKWLYNSRFSSLFLGHQHRPEKDHQAMAYVNDFPDDVPLVIISSQDDKVVPHKSSLNLALRVAAKRIEAIKAAEDNLDAAAKIMPVYFLQLDEGGHTASIGHPTSKIRYQNFLHAVYKQHQLPYIEEYAERGMADLGVSELTRGPLRAQIEYQKQFKEERSADTAEQLQKRLHIRHNALHQLQHELGSTRSSNSSAEAVSAEAPTPSPSIEQQHRMIKICSRMPLYAKYPTTFFGQTQAQMALMDSATQLSQMTTSANL